MPRKMVAALVPVMAGIVLASCGSSNDSVTTGAQGASTTTSAAPTTTAAPSSTPPDEPAACEVGTDPTGPISTFGFVLQEEPDPPSDWEPPAQEGFDWNEDGEADELALDPAGRVVVDWGEGSLTVTGVRVDFSDQPDIEVVPAAVADVTADGRLDLIVATDGTAGVVVGQGGASEDVSVAHDRIGQDVAGWLNPPVTPEVPPGVQADPPPVPFAEGTVVPMWDFTGDGVADWRVESQLVRAQGPVARYAGRPCA